jgi:carbonic anhydrase
MKKFCAVWTVILSVSATCLASAPQGEEKLTRMLQQSTLTLLKEGNLRFAEGQPFHPHLEATRRADLATHGQEPMATVLACSDSRDPVELIFDRGIGDLFVVRVAGNVAGLSELATIEYGVTHLGTTVLIVMGHSKCGAVTAAVQGGELHGHLPSLISLIKPATEKAKTQVAEEELVSRSIELNVWQQVENLFARSALIREAAAAGRVQIVGALYDIASGKVQWLGQHPEINRLLAEAKSAPEPSHAVAAPAPTAPAIALPAAPVHAEKSLPVAPSKPATAHLPDALRASASSPAAPPVTRTEVANSHH